MGKLETQTNVGISGILQRLSYEEY